MNAVSLVRLCGGPQNPTLGNLVLILHTIRNSFAEAGISVVFFILLFHPPITVSTEPRVACEVMVVICFMSYIRTCWTFIFNFMLIPVNLVAPLISLLFIYSFGVNNFFLLGPSPGELFRRQSNYFKIYIDYYLPLSRRFICRLLLVLFHFILYVQKPRRPGLYGSRSVRLTTLATGERDLVTKSWLSDGKTDKMPHSMLKDYYGFQKVHYYRKTACFSCTLSKLTNSITA